MWRAPGAFARSRGSGRKSASRWRGILQARLEEVLFEMLRALHARTKQKAVCLAGGVAFNCVANGKIFDETPFEKIFVQPASGDAGLAIGAAYFVHHQMLGQPRSFVMENAYWGPGYSPEQIARGGCSQPLARRGHGNFRASEEEITQRKRRRKLPTGKFSAGFKAAPSGVRARWEIAASSPIRAART